MSSYFFFFVLSIVVVVVLVSCLVRCRMMAARRTRLVHAEQHQAQINDANAYSQPYVLNGGGGLPGHPQMNYYESGYTYGPPSGHDALGRPVNAHQLGAVLMVTDENGANNGILGPQAAPLTQFFPQAHIVEYPPPPGASLSQAGASGVMPNMPPQLLPSAEGTYENQNPYGCAAYLPYSDSGSPKQEKHVGPALPQQSSSKEGVSGGVSVTTVHPYTSPMEHVEPTDSPHPPQRKSVSLMEEDKATRSEPEAAPPAEEDADDERNESSPDKKKKHKK